MHKLVLLLVLGVVFFGCGNKYDSTRFTQEEIALLKAKSATNLKVDVDSVIVINLNPLLNDQRFNFDSLVKEIKLVPLETNEESLLDRIRKIIITESNIYIYDDFKGGGIVIFDSDGNYIKRIPNGRGPGELFKLYDIAFDQQRNEFIAYQHSCLSFFTPDGQYVRQQKLPLIVYEMAVIPDGYVFKTINGQTNNHLGPWKNFGLLITDKNFKLISVGLPWQYSQVNLEGNNYLYNNNSLYITEKFKDTIYQYLNKDNVLKAKYTLNYSRKKIPERYLEGSFEEFEDAILQNDVYFYLGEYLDSQSHHVFFINSWFNESQLIVYRDKTSGNMKGGTRPYYNLNEMPPIAFPNTTFGDYLVSRYYPGENDLFASKSSIISDDDKLKVKGLTENDNPVIVLFKLKRF